MFAPHFTIVGVVAKVLGGGEVSCSVTDAHPPRAESQHSLSAAGWGGYLPPWLQKAGAQGPSHTGHSPGLWLPRF